MPYRLAPFLTTVSDLLQVMSLLQAFKMRFFLQLCTSCQNFNLRYTERPRRTYYDTELQQLVISAGRPLMLSG